MLPWLIAFALLCVALIFLLLWRRALAALTEAEQKTAATAERARAAESTARLQAAQLAALNAAEAALVILISDERRVLGFNQAAEAVFGPHAVTGQPLILATRSAELDELAAHTLAGGEYIDRHVMLGSQPYRARAACACADDAVLGAALVLQDISELQRLGRARRDFVANISHELRTPITSIRLLVDTLRGGAANDEEARHSLLEKISIETETLAQLAQELLDLAQIESGQVMLRLVPTPAHELLETAAARLDEQRARRGHTLTINGGEDLMVLVDPDVIGRALVNLVHNAIKFTPPGGHIELAAGRQGEMVQLSVRDTGPGILAQDLPRIFERFYRAAGNRSGSGTGLGLAIAKHVAEIHGGRLWAESSGLPGRGAVFYLELPPA